MCSVHGMICPFSLYGISTVYRTKKGNTGIVLTAVQSYGTIIPRQHGKCNYLKKSIDIG